MAGTAAHPQMRIAERIHCALHGRHAIAIESHRWGMPLLANVGLQPMTPGLIGNDAAKISVQPLQYGLVGVAHVHRQ
ncbi:hypothetical protein D3C84_1234270 [compost metagenome]